MEALKWLETTEGAKGLGVWLQELIKSLHMGRNVGLFGTLESQKDK